MQVKNIYCIKYDISRGNCFTVHKGNGSIRRFVYPPQGLYWINTQDSDGANGATLINADDKSNITVSSNIFTALIKTVDDKRYRYTHRSYLKLQLVRKIQRIIGIYYTKEYKRYVANNDMVDCSISLADMNTAGYIFGKDKGSLQRKTVLSKPHQIHTI